MKENIIYSLRINQTSGWYFIVLKSGNETRIPSFIILTSLTSVYADLTQKRLNKNK
jgi:hypothetical protein